MESNFKTLTHTTVKNDATRNRHLRRYESHNAISKDKKHSECYKDILVNFRQISMDQQALTFSSTNDKYLQYRNGLINHS
jgi:hypothetical protein